MRACPVACHAEAIDSEDMPLRGDCDKLRTAARFVSADLLSGAL